jgi:hypothetical protein
MLWVYMSSLLRKDVFARGEGRERVFEILGNHRTGLAIAVSIIIMRRYTPQAAASNSHIGRKMRASAFCDPEQC